MLRRARSPAGRLAEGRPRSINRAVRHGKVQYLEGLRGIAAVQVVLLHFVTGFLPDTAEHAAAPLHVLWDGHTAVYVFFLISGAVLTPSFARGGPWPRQAAKRLVRLGVPVAVAALVALVLLVAMVWKLTPPAARSFSAGWPPLERQVISFSAAVFGMSFLEFLMAQADKILIGFYLSAREVGVYAVSATLVAFVPIILQSVNQIFSPTIAELHARRERELLSRIFQTLTKWILGLTIPLASVMIIFAPGLMRIFGHEFEAGWPILVIGTAGQLVNCAVGSVGYLLLMSGEQKRLVRVQACMAVVMVVLSLLLIPRWGIIGAAAGAAITNAVSNFVYLWQVRRALGLSPYNRSYLRLLLPVTAAIGLLLSLRLGLSAVRPEWLVIGAGVTLAYLAFIGVALAFGLDADDRLIAEAVWSRLRGVYFREPRRKSDGRQHASSEIAGCTVRKHRAALWKAQRRSGAIPYLCDGGTPARQRRANG